MPSCLGHLKTSQLGCGGRGLYGTSWEPTKKGQLILGTKMSHPSLLLSSKLSPRGRL